MSGISTISVEAMAHQQKIAPPSTFNGHPVRQNQQHYLPVQAPLQDFIFPNNLLAILKLKFTGMRQAFKIFGLRIIRNSADFEKSYQARCFHKEVIFKYL